MQVAEDGAIKSCVLWVPRGRARAETSPDIETSPDAAVNESANAAAAATAALNAVPMGEEAIDRELNMDAYDDEDGMNDTPFGVSRRDIELAVGGDPLLQNNDDSDDDSSEGDREIRPSDFVLVVGNTEKVEESSLETYLYDHEQGSIFLHHDTMIQHFPTAVELIDTFGSHKGGQLLAVGSLAPVIEIWDNNVTDALEPVGVLTAVQSLDDEPEAEHMACTSLHANPVIRTQLASAHAHQVVLIWDLVSMSRAQTVSLHQSSVGAMKWHPMEATVMATGGEDKFLRLLDIRTPTKGASLDMGAEVEDICWNRHNPYVLMGALGDGRFVGVDVRKMPSTEGGASGGLLWEIETADSPLLCTSDSLVNGMVVTGSEDGMGSVWDIRGTNDTPKLIASRDLKVGALFCCASTPDASEPTLIAFGGREVVVWDVSESAAVESCFAASS